MITDEERREIAHKLRVELRYMKRQKEWFEEDRDIEKCGNRAYRNIAASVSESGNFIAGNYINIVERLSDLIDRPTCRNEEDGYGRSFLCSACGYEAWTYDDSGCDPKDFSFCPHCGAEIGGDSDGA